MLELVGVVVVGDGRERLDRCSFAARAGEILGLVGGSGAGKTTILEVAAGLVRIDRGRVQLEGRDATRSPGRLRRAGALVAHEVPGPPDARVADWLDLWADLDAVPRADRPARIKEALERFELPGDLLVARLSHGRLRRLGFARAWVRRPRLYLLDGPEEGLDGEGLRRLTAALREAAAGGATVVLTSAAPHLPTAVCDRAICLKDGAVTDEVSRADADFGRRIAAAQGWSA